MITPWQRTLPSPPLARPAIRTASLTPASPAAPTEQLQLTHRADTRPPGEAIVFLERFDDQLGLSEAMKQEKRELMAASPHAFFRALPALFYHDLHSTYKERSQLLPQPAPLVATVGDAHLLNAGTFRGPDGQAVWGLNDFDQAEIGSPEWDLERMGVSLYLAARSGDLSSSEARALIRTMGSAYLEALGETGPAFLERGETSGKVRELVDKASGKDRIKFLDKWTSPDRRSLVRGEDLEDPEPGRGRQVLEALHQNFPELTILDLAAKPHSGGSTRGLERYYSLVDRPGGDPWILEVKAVLPSPVQVPDGDLRRGDGSKILAFQKQMGSPVDHRHRAFRLGEVAFFTRERELEKDSLKDKAKNLSDLAPQLGRVLARAHTASGADLPAWVGNQGEQLLDNLESFSQLYARQVESDYRAFVDKYPPPPEPESAPPPKTNPSPDSYDGYLMPR